MVSGSTSGTSYRLSYPSMVVFMPIEVDRPGGPWNTSTPTGGNPTTSVQQSPYSEEILHNLLKLGAGSVEILNKALRSIVMIGLCSITRNYFVQSLLE